MNEMILEIPLIGIITLLIFSFIGIMQSFKLFILFIEWLICNDKSNKTYEKLEVSKEVFEKYIDDNHLPLFKNTTITYNTPDCWAAYNMETDTYQIRKLKDDN